ncbi:hypothetical protein ACFJIY_14530 [Pimelobacter simplex]|uniref:hypothetical protein n=1 Tax=Nocardioides simplex TaxID=2045 RepID=UPI00366BF982
MRETAARRSAWLPLLSWSRSASMTEATASMVSSMNVEIDSSDTSRSSWRRSGSWVSSKQIVIHRRDALL